VPINVPDYGAVGRPMSSVAHHVNVLVDVGLMGVVRTRRVRALRSDGHIVVSLCSDQQAARIRYFMI
jgi:hypothetical protein